MPIPFSRTTSDTPNRRSFLKLSGGLATGAAVLGLAAALLPGRALAEPLDDLRNKGVVGERVDGYAEIRKPGEATAEIRQTVTDINAKREAFYKKKAAEQGVDPNAIGKIYAKAILDKAPSGWWFKTADGSWKQK